MQKLKSIPKEEPPKLEPLSLRQHLEKMNIASALENEYMERRGFTTTQLKKEFRRFEPGNPNRYIRGSTDAARMRDATENEEGLAVSDRIIKYRKAEKEKFEFELQ